MQSKRREACPWYGSSMRTQPQRQELNGEPVRRPARMPPGGLYRYVPVPPAYYDADGYLVEDGMTQTDRHAGQTAFWHYALKRRLPTATVCMDLAMHYREGNQEGTVVPDLFVALRAPPLEERTYYKLWEYPLPELVVEMLSKTTWQEDVGRKRDTYAYLGVREYWLFDPAGFGLPTPLVGLRLRAGRYREIRADAAGRLRSRVLGLDLHVRDGELRFRDPETGEDLRTYDEFADRAEEAERERTTERNRANAAENRASVAENRASVAEDGLAAERNRADRAENERDVERRRADAAERELARLRSRLGGS